MIVASHNKEKDMTEKQKRFHGYACAALQGLISKTPLLDNREVSQDLIENMHKDLAESAFEYAACMNAEWERRFGEGDHL